MLAINLFGGTATGRKLISAALLCELIKAGVTPVVIHESWEAWPPIPSDPIYGLALQNLRIGEQIGKGTHAVIVMQPLPLFTLYPKMAYSGELEALAKRLWDLYTNLNFYLAPVAPELVDDHQGELFEPDAKLRRLMRRWGILAETVTDYDIAATRLANRIMRYIPNRPDSPSYA